MCYVTVRSRGGNAFQNAVRMSAELKAQYGPLSRAEKKDLRVVWYSKELVKEEEQFAASRDLTESEESTSKWLTL